MEQKKKKKKKKKNEKKKWQTFFREKSEKNVFTWTDKNAQKWKINRSYVFKMPDNL